MSRQNATQIATPEEVLEYWFGQPAKTVPDAVRKTKRWFEGGFGLDDEINARFGATVDAAMAGQLDAWASTPRGRLALILVLDQLTRNRFRGRAEMYDADPKAQALALAGLDGGAGDGLEVWERIFLIMPLHHAEDLALQRRARRELEGIVADATGPWTAIVPASIEQSDKYNAMIERFGRFPHRNEILGRDSTAEEQEVLRDWADKGPPQHMKQMEAQLGL